MEEINLKTELQEERENLIWTLNAIRNNPVFIDEEYRTLIYAVKHIMKTRIMKLKSVAGVMAER